MCWARGNGYIWQSAEVFFFFHWSSKRSWRKGNKPLKCITQSNLLLQLYTNHSFVKRTFIKCFFFFLNIRQIIEFVFKLSLFSLFFIHFQGSLEEIQGILNTTEISLHQLTALVDCRSLHMVSGGGMPHKHTHSCCAVTPHLPQNVPATDSYWRLCSAARSYEANPFFMVLTTPVTIDKNSLLCGKLCILDADVYMMKLPDWC